MGHVSRFEDVIQERGLVIVTGDGFESETEQYECCVRIHGRCERRIYWVTGSKTVQVIYTFVSLPDEVQLYLDLTLSRTFSLVVVADDAGWPAGLIQSWEAKRCPGKLHI